MTDREEAIRRLAAETEPVPKDEPFQVRSYEPSDGPGVARLFYAVYGDGYPVDTFYLPERLTEENRFGRIRSVVACTDSGQVVSHIAFYRSSPPNPNLYEYGLGLTLPSYRNTIAFFRCNQLLLTQVGEGGISAFFSEAVCNHVVTQKLSRWAQALETALEPALMPSEAYTTEQSALGRVGCLLYSRTVLDCRRISYLPPAYQQEIKFLLEGLNLDREWKFSDSDILGEDVEIEVKRFDSAGVARCTVTKPGKAFPAKIGELERELREAGYALVQFFVDLGKPWAGAVTEQLRRQGFSLGGLLPVWFGDDGLLMQKHFVDPDFDGMKIHTDRGRLVFEMVRTDWERRGKR